MIHVYSVSGPLVRARIGESSKMPKFMEIVYIGHKKLLGEVIAINDDTCAIQVYEDTTGVMVGDEVILTHELLTVELGPGLIGTMFDGIQRPLEAIDKKNPVFIPAGLHIPPLDQQKVWEYTAVAFAGEVVESGAILGSVQESSLVTHKILMPPLESLILQEKQKVYPPFKIIENKNAHVTIVEKHISIEDARGYQFSLGLSHKWPVKQARAVKKKIPATKLFKTGQRVIDAFFPILLGSPVSTPGPFGAGKTFTQQQVAKWSDAEIVVYVGCGERGNEMAEMVNLFPTLTDPRSGKPLMDRTIVIANTSNMPIAAREASIYTGISIAEYYRDMGYNVVLMADSTSRWAESMREISARLEELPAEEGYPAYLSSRVSAFYARSGQAYVLSGLEGSVTIIGTVSPAGGDFSDPVVQVSLKNSQVFLALDAELAAKRHYPSINWGTSYSLNETRVHESAESYWSHGKTFTENVRLAKEILDKEDSLLNLVKLVGLDGLSYTDRVIMEIGRSIREDFLQQNGFDAVDTYCDSEKMQYMLDMILGVYKKSLEILHIAKEPEITAKKIYSDEVKTLLSQAKYNESADAVKQTIDTISQLIESI